MVRIAAKNAAFLTAAVESPRQNAFPTLGGPFEGVFGASIAHPVREAASHRAIFTL